MSPDTSIDLPLPWVQRCLLETGWSDWQPQHAIGIGAWSIAVMVTRGGRKAVLLLDRPDRPVFTKPGVTGLAMYQSAAAIRLACRRIGLPVARTLGAPRPWSGGAAVLLSRVPGRDLEHMLHDPGLDGFAIGVRVAEIVRASRILGQAHRTHKKGYGTHLFGMRPPRTTDLDAWSVCIAPLLGHDRNTDILVANLMERASRMLADVPRTTQIWDVGDRNIMLDGEGQVVGLVDQVDMFTGDPMLVPGFSLAMLGDVHGWSQVEPYENAWRQTWELDNEQWQRVRLHRLACHGRFIGKRWQSLQPEASAKWRANVRLFLEDQGH